MEVLGGNGYVDEGPMGLLYKEAPLNSIWEGAGNVMCLDVLRAAQKDSGVIEAYVSEIEKGRGANAGLDEAIDRLKSALTDQDGIETRARKIVERMMLVLQGALLVRHAPDAVADAFCRSRLSGDWGHAYGTLPKDVEFRTIIDHANPA
jgi:putative acyl-CoA dehydrogenase